MYGSVNEEGDTKLRQVSEDSQATECKTYEFDHECNYDAAASHKSEQLSSRIQEREKCSNVVRTVLILVTALSFAMYCVTYKTPLLGGNDLYKLVEHSDGMSYLQHLESLDTPRFSELSEAESRLLFVGFKSKYTRAYKAVSEEEERYKIFKNNLLLIDKRNADEKKAGGSAIHGLTKFCDLDPKEFLTARPMKSSKKHSSSGGKKSVSEEEVDKYSKSGNDGEVVKKTKVDWSGIYTTRVRDQGRCGGCWAVSTVSQIESDAIRLGLWKKDDYLSIQQLMSCDTDSMGCKGGWTESGLNYVIANGLVKESDYPFADYEHSDTTATCDYNPSKTVMSITDAFYLHNEERMINHVLNLGPLSVCIDGSTMLTYKSGILAACGDTANHCVQAVGVNLDEGYWKIRNDWSTEWGEDGYIRIKAGVDACAITTDPMYTVPVLIRHATVQVKIISASDLQDHDLFQYANPYVMLKLGKEDYISKPVKGSLSPVWDEEAEMNWDGISPLVVEIYDSDPIFMDVSMGRLELQLNKKDYPDAKTVHLNEDLGDVKQGKIKLDIRVNPVKR